MHLSGIQSLTVLLCVSLVIITGVLIGAISITNGVELVDKARNTGQNGIDNCLASGEQDLRTIAARYLQSVVNKTENSVLDYLQVPEKSLMELAALAKAYHPDVSTSPTFINDVLRANMRTRLSVLAPQGTDQIGYFPFPYSPSHPTTNPTGDIAWGGDLVFFMANFAAGVLPKTGPTPVLLLESRLADGTWGQNSTHIELGQADDLGVKLYRDQPCRSYINWNEGEVMGHCPVPKEFVASEGWVEMHKRSKWNAFTASGVLSESDVVQFTPVVANSFYLTIFATLTFTHPDMLNLSPRQGNRVGTLLASLEGEGLANIFRDDSLPKGALLYCVDRNAWTGTVGTLLAYNAGKFSKFVRQNLTGGTREYEVINTVNIVNHTQDNTTLPSTISQHGRYVFTYADNYDAMVNATSKIQTFHEWTCPNGTLYWTVTSLLARSGSYFYINLLVPRSSVMHEIDVSRENIRHTTAEEMRDSDAQQRRSLILTLSITVVVVVFLLAVAVVFAKLITAPLTALADDMANVAVMNLEAVNVDGRVSKLCEVANMQTSFSQMVRNLVEYRNYMPQSVLVNDDSESETLVTTSPSAVVSNSRRVTSVEMGDCGSSGVGTPTSTLGANSSFNNVRKAAGFHDTHTLKKKAVTVLAFNMKSWHEYISNMSGSEVISGHADVMSILLQCVQGNKGICDVFTGDRLLATYNAFSVMNCHRIAAVQSAYTARGRFETVFQEGGHPQLSFAVSTGDAKIGHMGCNGMKKVAIISSILPWVTALERYNNVHGFSGVVDSFVARDVRGHFDLQLTDAILYTKRSANAIRVFELQSIKTAKEEGEWMYQIESMEVNSPFKHWNKAFEFIFAGEWDNAEQVIHSTPSELQEVCHITNRVGKKLCKTIRWGFFFIPH